MLSAASRSSTADVEYHPIGVWCDNTGEFLAAELRTGRAGSDTAVDHIQVLGEAVTQIRSRCRIAATC